MAWGESVDFVALTMVCGGWGCLCLDHGGWFIVLDQSWSFPEVFRFLRKTPPNTSKWNIIFQTWKKFHPEMNSETFLHMTWKSLPKCGSIDPSILVNRSSCRIDRGWHPCWWSTFEAWFFCVFETNAEAVRMAENSGGNLRHQAWPSRHIYVLV